MILTKPKIPALRRHAQLAIGVILLCSTTVWAQSTAQGETVLIKRAAQLREQPSESSRSIMPLALQTSVVRLGEKQGAWIKVSAPDNTLGWVHMFDVTAPGSSAAATGNMGASALRGITSFFNRGSAQAPGSNVATSTLGIRGLGAENLNNAQPNVAAVSQAETFRIDATQARQFGSAASLVTHVIDPLPTPEANP